MHILLNIARLILRGLWRIDWLTSYIKYVLTPVTQKGLTGHIVFEKPFSSSKVFCIFALWQNNRLDPNCLEYLKILHASGIHILTVNTGVLTIEGISDIQPYCWAYIERANQGQDIGSYRCGFFHLQEALKQAQIVPDKVIFCNDSVFIVKSFLKDFLRLHILENPLDWLGVISSEFPIYHVTSWFFSVSNKIWCADFFRTFWEKYKPLNSRTYNVYRGEVALSQHLIQNKYFPHIAYPKIFLVKALCKDIEDTNFDRKDCAWMFPEQFTHIPLHQITNKTPEIILEKSTSSNIRLNETHLWQIYAVLRQRFPFIKKDLYRRRIYDLLRLKNFFYKLREIDESCAAQAETEILKRSPDKLSYKDRLLVRLSLK